MNNEFEYDDINAQKKNNEILSAINNSLIQLILNDKYIEENSTIENSSSIVLSKFNNVFFESNIRNDNIYNSSYIIIYKDDEEIIISFTDSDKHITEQWRVNTYDLSSTFKYINIEDIDDNIIISIKNFEYDLKHINPDNEYPLFFIKICNIDIENYYGEILVKRSIYDTPNVISSYRFKNTELLKYVNIINQNLELFKLNSNLVLNLIFGNGYLFYKGKIYIKQFSTSSGLIIVKSLGVRNYENALCLKDILEDNKRGIIPLSNAIIIDGNLYIMGNNEDNTELNIPLDFKNSIFYKYIKLIILYEDMKNNNELLNLIDSMKKDINKVSEEIINIFDILYSSYDKNVCSSIIYLYEGDIFSFNLDDIKESLKIINKNKE